MKDYESLSHTKWDCKYHMVFIPKYRRKRMFGRLRQHLGEIFRELAKQKESRIVEGHLMADHVHMCISIPPKLAVSSVVGFIKGGRVRFRLRGTLWVGNGISRVRVSGHGATWSRRTRSISRRRTASMSFSRCGRVVAPDPTSLTSTATA